jgi:diguanylate cyclase (GGDEF)-like protein
MKINQLDTAYERNELCQKIEPLLNYDENCNSALIIINVWHTRQISAHHGYDVSQEILSLIAGELQAFVKEKGLLLRTASHEFALLLQNIKNAGHCQLALNKIMRDLDAQTIELADFTTKTKLTAGAALYPKHAATAQHLVQNVEVALTQSELREVSSLIYSDNMSDRIIKQLKIESQLEAAIKNKTLELWYQPKINLENGSIYGVEALTRWNSESEGYISPEIFIPIAEQRNFIQELTDWVLNLAFRTQVEWKELGLDINMAVNISGKVIDDEDFVTLVEHTRGIWNPHPSRITLEVTETAMMQSMETSLDKLNTLKSHGFQLSIDDFGTGYSSLEYFKTLPVHEIKIDKSFVKNMMTNQDDYNLVEMITGLAKSFSLNMVAEGIEDNKTMEALRELGVQRAQGYYISKPMPEEEFLTWAEFYLANLR